MSDKTAQAMLITGVLGTVAGIGYALATRGRSDVEAEEPDKADAQADGNQAEGKAGNGAAPQGESGAGAILEPLPGPSAPLAEPVHALAHKRINWSTTDDAGTVNESPSVLLTQAARFDVHIDFDELTGARLIASEHASATFTEAACIVDCELNRAERRRRTLYRSLTHADTFGKQGRKRPASTRRDPRYRHVLAARAVLTGKARGIARGATRFFDPVAMEAMHRKYRRWVEGGRQGKRPSVVSCDALTLLEAWSFDLGRGSTGNRCPPDRSKHGRHTLAWVGPIPGVDALRLFLMKPLPIGAMHTRHYEAARALLRAGLKKE